MQLEDKIKDFLLLGTFVVMVLPLISQPIKRVDNQAKNGECWIRIPKNC